WTVTPATAVRSVEVEYGFGGSPPSNVTSSPLVASLIALSIEQGSDEAHGSGPLPPTSAKRSVAAFAVAGRRNRQSSANAESGLSRLLDPMLCSFVSGDRPAVCRAHAEAVEGQDQAGVAGEGPSLVTGQSQLAGYRLAAEIESQIEMYALLSHGGSSPAFLV